MLKNILKLKGAQKLTKNEQKSINGGEYTEVPTTCDSYYISSGTGECIDGKGRRGNEVIINDRYYCCV